ncbi:MAG: exo-beta-1,3-glucanase (GH17 family) [Cocleimonas sp.]|jgi:exo-beta-1,3-glucanase (GH17 family)
MSKGYQDYFPAHSKSSAYPIERTSFYSSSDASLQALSCSSLTHEEKINLFKQILEKKVHGISYSPYMDGQSPGTDISPQQILHRLDIIKNHTNWIRTFSCIEGNEETPRIAHENGLKTMVGVGIGKDKEENEIEFENALKIAKAGHANILAIGNEVLLRGDITEDELLEYIDRAKKAVPDVQVGYVDAYFLFENHPRVADACDLLLINCYPFWEYTPAEYALSHMKDMYQRAINVAKGKKVIISETGWPNIGTPYGGSVPSPENALEYFINAALWAEEEQIDMFYFSSFDESWKVGDEGDVGAYWGLWDKDGNLKYI